MEEAQDLLEDIAGVIAGLRLSRPVLVAIEGSGAAGKTRFAAQLAPLVEKRGRDVVVASIDDFHRPKAQRYAQGRLSPRGCYEDTFDYPAVRDALLLPLIDGRPFVTAVLDGADMALTPEARLAAADTILLFEGVWLQRPELSEFWDYRILLVVDEATAFSRGVARDLAYGGTPEQVRELWQKRYLPADRIYFETVRPQQTADLVIDNTHPSRRVLVRGR